MDPNGWLLVDILGEHPGFFRKAPLTILTCNRMPPTEQTSLKASWMESPFLAKKKWAHAGLNCFFPHERKRIATKKDVKLPDPGGKKQKSDWCKQWIAAEAAERPQTNQLPKYYPDPFNLQTSSIRISHSQNTEFGDITPNTVVSFSNVSMVSWSFELEVEHWEDFLYIYIYIVTIQLIEDTPN